MRLLPLRFERRKVTLHLGGPLGHDRVVWLQLGDLPGCRIEGEAVRLKDRGELGVRGDDRGAEGADCALLPEQRRSIQPAPGTGGLSAGADLEMNMPVRVTRTARAVRDCNRLQRLDRHDLLRTPRPDTGHRVLR